MLYVEDQPIAGATEALQRFAIPGLVTPEVDSLTKLPLGTQAAEAR
jgi:hypothetical protein